ncbi:MAG: regulatory protein RecX [Bacteroidota bacterium]
MALDKEDTHYQRAAYYCSYQERTEKEVREKLHAWGVTQKEATHIVHALKQDRFLDEERYIEAFVRGKFLAKKWGKRKLWATLINKGLDRTLIQKELSTIDDSDYLRSLRQVAEKKKQLLVGITAKQATQKLTNYLLQKGYEPNLVIPTVQEMIIL